MKLKGASVRILAEYSRRAKALLQVPRDLHDGAVRERQRAAGRVLLLRALLRARGGHGERSRLHLLFKLGGTDDLSISTLNVLAVNRPFLLYTPVPCQKVSSALHTVSKSISIHRGQRGGRRPTAALQPRPRCAPRAALAGNLSVVYCW